MNLFFTWPRSAQCVTVQDSSTTRTVTLLFIIIVIVILVVPLEDLEAPLHLARVR